MEQIILAVLSKEGFLAMLVLILLGLLGWTLRYLFRYLVTDTKLKTQLVSALQSLRETIKSRQ